MKRTMTVTVEIDLDELPDKERAESAKLEKVEPDNLPSLTDVDPGHVAELIEDSLFNDEEFWGGSGMYAKVAKVRTSGARWK